MARDLSNAGNDKLRHGQVEEARRLLETGCQMSADIARSRPRQFIPVLVGHAVFSIEKRQLEPLYKDFGMKAKLAELRGADAAYRGASEAIRDFLDEPPPYAVRMARQQAAPLSLYASAYVAAVVLLLSALGWILPAIRRRRKRESIAAAPWAKGWLARTLLAVFIPVAIAVAIFALTARYELEDISPVFTVMLNQFQVGVVITFAGEMLLLALVLRKLHHSLDEHTGERTGIFRFIFKASAAAKAWTRKYVMAAMLGQFVFLACCAMLATILYKPILGCHFWQTSRLKASTMSREAVMVDRITAPLEDIDLTCRIGNPVSRTE